MSTRSNVTSRPPKWLPARATHSGRWSGSILGEATISSTRARSSSDPPRRATSAAGAGCRSSIALTAYGPPPARRERSADRTLHLQLDQPAPLHRVLHGQRAGDGLDEAVDDHAHRLLLGEAAA